MLTRFSIKVAALLASVLFLAAPVAFGQITVNPTTREGLKEYKIKFTSAHAIDTISEPIRSCSNMTVFWERSNTTQVTAYAADSDDDTVDEIEANAVLGTFTATAKTSLSSEKAYVRFVVDAVTVGSVPSTAVVVCSEYAQRGGSRSDADGDGLYEFAYLWDADGDGSSFVPCTADATPDIACKAVGERIYRDAIDDINCAIHGCVDGLGSMEKDGTLILPEGVLVGFACWDASNPSENDPVSAETNDNLHDSSSIDTAALANCARDNDNKFLTSISLQGWQGTLLGSGVDTRRLERATMSSTVKRDKGTYLVNDMGPWNDTSDDNVWFDNSDNQRFISAGYHNLFGANNHTGTSSADGDSKGWGRIAADVTDLDIWTADLQTVCVVDSGGVAGTDYSASGWAQTLRPGDLVLVPVFPTTGADAATVQEVIIRVTPTVQSCGAGNMALTFGGSPNRQTTAVRTYPANAFKIVASGQKIGHARSDYQQTRARISNMTIEPQDWWNELGGRCTNSGTPWRTVAGDIGTFFSLTIDDTNTDFSCDTMSLLGMWGGGTITIEDVVVKNFHQFAVDGGSTGGLHTLNNVRFMYGQGEEIADAGNGWRFFKILVDQSSFSGGIITSVGPGLLVDDFEVRNSVFDNILTLNANNEMARIRNVRNLSNGFNHNIKLVCGARWSKITGVYTTGRTFSNNGGTSASIYFDCDNASNPAEQNVVEDIVMDAPDSAETVGGTTNEQNPIILFNADSATNVDVAPFAGMLGNVIRDVRAIGYGGQTGPHSGCLYGVFEAGGDSPPDDDGESDVFTYNYFDGGSIHADGRVFCVDDGLDRQDIDSTGAATPAWGDPQGCGNMDGGVVYADENCA